MNEAKIKRINELAHKAKNEGLTAEETMERQVLREEYIQAYRRNLQSQLDSIVVVEKDGSKHKLKQKRVN